MSVAPESYGAWDHGSPVLDRLGDLRRSAAQPGCFGFIVDTPKLNHRGFLHAGAISTLADVCIGHTLAAAPPPAPLVTVELNVTLVGVGVAGRWIDVVVEPHHVGRRFAAGAATFRDADRTIALATAAFMPA